jgi:hypothetical protein
MVRRLTLITSHDVFLDTPHGRRIWSPSTRTRKSRTIAPMIGQQITHLFLPCKVTF